jgi:hypothetical protein
VSVARADVPLAAAAIADLRRRHPEVEVVEHPTLIGDWRESCRETIRACDAVLLVAGPAADTNENVQWELATAEALGVAVLRYEAR